MVRCSSVFLTLLVACGPVKGNPTATDAPVDGAEPGFQLAVLTVNAAAPLDGDATVSLAVTRVGGFEGEIAIAAVTPPTGLEVDPLIIPAGESTGDLIVGAVSPLAIGDTISFTVEATADGVDSKQLEIEDADITGKPGSLDDSFGVGTGYAFISFGADDGGSFNSLDVLGGNLIATGIGQGGLGASRFSTMRFTSTGAIDTGFGGGALVRTSFIGGSNEDTRSAAIGHQNDGRPILIGSNHSGTTGDIVLARLSTTGGSGGFEFGNQADPGEAILDLGGEEVVGSNNAAVGDGAVLPDGRIVAVGVSNNHHVIMLAAASGVLDGALNTSGFVRDVLGNASAARRVVIDGDGKIIVAGTTSGVTDDLTLHRYTTAGLDTSFAAGGRNILTTAGASESVFGVVVLPNGTIFLGSVDGMNFQIRRFDADGMLDTTFGTGGLVVTSVPSAVAKELVVLPDGKLLVLAQLGTDAVLVRFRVDGMLDPLFGTNGVVNVPMGDDSFSTTVNTFIVYDAHKIVIAGGNENGVPGPGTKGLLARVWM